MMDMLRTLVAGFGNVLRGDDGFGVRVVQALEQMGGLGPDVALLEVGTGGIGLVQALMDPFGCLIIVDATSRGREPGTLSVLEVEDVDDAEVVDLHLATPSQALPLAQTLGVLPRRVFLVGCEAMDIEELTMELSPRVSAAVPRAVAAIRQIVETSRATLESETRA